MPNFPVIAYTHNSRGKTFIPQRDYGVEKKKQQNQNVLHKRSGRFVSKTANGCNPHTHKDYCNSNHGVNYVKMAIIAQYISCLPAAMAGHGQQKQQWPTVAQSEIPVPNK